MSSTHRQRDGCLPIVLLAALFVLVPRTGAAMRGGGGPPFGLSGAGTFGSTFARGAFKSNGFAGPRFGGHRVGHRRHGDRGFGYAYSGFPYYDYGYDPYYDERPAASSPDRPRRYQHSGYCDVSGKYPQDCVWKDGP